MSVKIPGLMTMINDNCLASSILVVDAAGEWCDVKATMLEDD